jgi:hypothetical protein
MSESTLNQTQLPDTKGSGSSTSAESTGIWPGGWFVYENGRVDGPMAAEKAFSLDHHASNGKPRLVSRKGFSQWYPLSDLSEIFRLTDQMGRKANSEKQKSAELMSEASMIAQMERFSALQKKVSPPLAPASEPARHVTPPPPAKEASAKPSQPETKPPEKVAKPGRPEKLNSMAQPFSEPAPKSFDAKPLTAKNASVQKNKSTLESEVAAPASRNVRVTRNELMTEYFLQRGRMRLGKIRQAWLVGFVGMPLSLGVYWFVWFRDMAHELAFHIQNEKEAGTKMPPAIFALVPFVHVFMVFRLAKLLRNMEEQNKYRSVSPKIAALFSLIPPFAMTYLQDAANRHWLLHAKHAAVRRIMHPH